MNALVLGGGGSRGAYQVGAIRALKELGYDFQIVTGASVGALNALFLGHKKYDLVQNMWTTIDFENVINHKYTSKNKSLETIKAAFKNKGLTLDPLEKLINENVEFDLLKDSPVKIGFVVTGPKGKYLPMKVEDIKTKKELVDNIIASCSAYPILKKREINGELCYDGGFSDKLPVELAKQMGAKKIIAIDIMIGVRKKAKLDNVEFLYIKPSKKLGFFLNFNRNALDKNIQLGYDDIMRNKDKILDFINK